MKRSILIALEVMTGIAIGMTNAHAEGLSIRESLINDEGVAALYTVDERHTLTVGADPKVDGVKDRVIAEFGEGTKKAFMVRHTEDQPFVYKNADVPAFAEVTLPEGEVFKLSALPWDKASYTGIDLYQHAAAVCKKAEGTLGFLITKKNGGTTKLTEVGATEAFENIFLSGTNPVDGAWFIKCEAKGKRFLVEKNYRSFTKGVDTARVFKGRGFEGYDFVQNNTAPELPKRVNADPARLAGERVKMAIEVASMRMGFVKAREDVKFTGEYNGRDGSACDQISIKEAGESTNGWKERVYDFEVCSDRVASLGERELKKETGLLARVSR